MILSMSIPSNFFYNKNYDIIQEMTKRTYQPKKIKRARKHGFRERNKSKHGREVMRRRTQKRRRRITI